MYEPPKFHVILVYKIIITTKLVEIVRAPNLSYFASKLVHAMSVLYVQLERVETHLRTYVDL